MGKLLRVKPFVLLMVAWLAGLVRLHAWAQEEASTCHPSQQVGSLVALTRPVDGTTPESAPRARKARPHP